MPSGTDRRGLLLAALYLAAALHGLGAADIVGDDEAREAGIVQEIVAGRWLWPSFNGETLPDKPVLYHWLAALACAPGGFSEAAARLPSALAGAALVAWTARFGAALLGPQAGLVAAALLATDRALFAHARVARPDVLMLLLLALALGAAWRWWSDGRARDATRALALLGLATLAKGPVAPTLFALTLLVFLAWQRDLRRLPRLLTVPGVAAFAVLGLGWYALALAGWGDVFVREHLVGRYLRNLLGGLPAGEAYSPSPLSYHVLFYAKHLPLVALPWTPFVVLALWQAWRRDRLGDPRTRFLVAWAAAPLLAFTPAEWKLRYYLLPCLPPLMLLAAPSVLALWRAPGRRRVRPAALLAALAIGAALGLVVWAAASGRLAVSRSDRATLDGLLPLVPWGAAGAAAVVGLAAAGLVAATAAGAWRVVIGTVAAGATLWVAVGEPALARSIAARESLRPFAEEVGRRYPEPAALVVLNREPIRTLVVYAGRRIPTVTRLRDVPPPAHVITPGDTYRTLAAKLRLGPEILTGEGRVGNVGRARLVVAAPRY